MLQSKEVQKHKNHEAVQISQGCYVVNINNLKSKNGYSCPITVLGVHFK